MSRALLILLLIPLAACGIKRPLMRPSEVPAYEQKRAEHDKKFSVPANDSTTPNASSPDMSGPTAVPSMQR